MKIAENNITQSEIVRPFAIDLWICFEKRIVLETNEEFSRSKFVIQKDAYSRLSDDDVESDVPWMSYINDAVTADSEFEFQISFFKDGININAGPVLFEVLYLGLSMSQTALNSLDIDSIPRPDPDKVAINLINIITIMLNGQFVIGCSYKNGNLLAAESFILGYEQAPYPIGIIDRFSYLHSSASEYGVRQNSKLSQRIKISDNFPLLPPIVDGRRVKRGRITDSVTDLAPLNRKLLTKLKNNFELHEFGGKKDEQNSWKFLYGKTEFWLVVISYIAIISFLKFSTVTPQLFHSDGAQFIYIVIAWVAIPAGAGALIGRRQSRIDLGRPPITVKFENIIKKIFGKAS